MVANVDWKMVGEFNFGGIKLTHRSMSLKNLERPQQQNVRCGCAAQHARLRPAQVDRKPRHTSDVYRQTVFERFYTKQTTSDLRSIRLKCDPEICR